MQPQQNLIKRKDYKNIKHMDRVSMTAYLHNVYRRGFEAGFAAAKKKATTETKPADTPPDPDHPIEHDPADFPVEYDSSSGGDEG